MPTPSTKTQRLALGTVNASLRRPVSVEELAAYLRGSTQDPRIASAAVIFFEEVGADVQQLFLREIDIRAVTAAARARALAVASDAPIFDFI